MTSSEPANDHQQLIRDVPLLARLPEGDLAALASRGKECTFPEGAVVFREGEAGDSLHVIMHGRVRISVTSAQGTEATLSFIDRGDCFGDMAIFDGGARTATATAVAPTRTFVVTREDFVAWLMERPAAAIALLETLSLRLRQTDEALTDLSFLDLPHRLAKRLAALAEANPGARGRIRITQADLASLLSVSRESVNKQLNALQRDGLLSLTRGHITILDLRALRELSES
ncbi:MAG: Crp/Fnr family transcriptional regulator [Tepidiformaceae bacterium]